MSTPRPGDYTRVHAPMSIQDSGVFKVLFIKDDEASLAKATVWEDTKAVAKKPIADLIKAEPSEMDLLGCGYFSYLKIVTDHVRSGESFDQVVRRLPKGTPAEVRDLLRELVGKELATKVAASRVAAAYERHVVIAGVKETGRLTTGQIDLEYRRLWERAATIAEVQRVAFNMGIDDDYDPDENEWVDAASEAFDISNGDVLSIDDEDADLAGVLWKDYTDSVNREAEDDSALDRFVVHVGSALWPEKRTATSKTTGNGTSVGFFVPLPKELAEQFPSLGKEDSSSPHVTILYVGEVPKAREDEFIAVAMKSLAREPGPVLATLGEPDFFVHPDKDRRVWYSRVSFSKDVAEIRDRLWLALEEAGFTVAHSFPLAVFPHVTLAYVPGAHTHAKWDGPVPIGAWSFDSVAVWGLRKDMDISLGTYQAQAFADVARATVASRMAAFPKGVDHVELYHHVFNTLRNKRMPRWNSFMYGNREIEVFYPDPDKGISKSLWLRFPGSADTYQWSPRAEAWLKVRQALPPEEPKPKEREVGDEELEFYRQTPDEIVKTLKSYPRSMLQMMALRKELLPPEALALLDSVGYQFQPSATRVAARWVDQIPGGLGDKKKPSDFDAEQVAAGVKVEMEHTDDPALAREIAVDHLTEDPDYYVKLKKVEKHEAGSSDRPRPA